MPYNQRRNRPPRRRSAMYGGGGVNSRNFLTGCDIAQLRVSFSEAVTLDRIVMDVYAPSASNSGLPSGAPALTANRYQTIDFVYSGTLSELYRNGANYFSGIIANVRGYSSGVVVLDMPIDETFIGSNTVRNRVPGGATGTLINGTSSDSEKFTQIENGWIGQNFLINSQFDGSSPWQTTGSNWNISGGVASSSPINTSLLYQAVIRPDVYVVGGTISNYVSGSLQLYDGSIYDQGISSNGNFEVTKVNANLSYGFFTTRSEVDGDFVVDNLTAKRLLESA